MVQRLMAMTARLQSRSRSTPKIMHRRLVVLYLRDDVLVIHTKEPSHQPGKWYVRESLNLLAEVFRHYHVTTEFYPLKPFQCQHVDWHPVYSDWQSMMIDRPMLEERCEHDCCVSSIVGHEFEMQLLARLPEGVQQFVSDLRNR